MSLKEIAEEVGVSISTVSRILNHPEYNKNDEGLRERVFKAARKLNYIPNEAARNLKCNSDKDKNHANIMIIVTRVDSMEVDPFYRELIREIEREVHNSRNVLTKIIYKSELSDEKKCTNLDIHKEINVLFKDSGKIDGIVVIGRCVERAVDELLRHSENIVAVSRNPLNYKIDEVVCDGKKIARDAIDYLISLGHRNIAYVGDCHKEARFKGYQETLFRYNISYEPDYIIKCKISEEDGIQAIKELIELENPPTAIYCANDIIAIGMLKYLSMGHNRYYRPSIISSDDIEEAQYTSPMLTTVHLPKREMAKFAYYLLTDRMKKGHSAVTRIESEGTLIRRESCSDAGAALECEYII